MSAQQWLQAELRLLYEYQEHTTYQRDAQRILTGLVAFSSTPPPVTLADALDRAGVDVQRIRMLKGGEMVDLNPEVCTRIMSDGAECGYDLVNGGVVCDYGHRQ